MKLRAGFVSNSSSSSFVIGIKNHSTLSAAALTESLGVPETSALIQFAKDVSQYIAEHAEETTVESMLYNYGYDTLEEAVDADVIEAVYLQKGYKVYSLLASRNESDDPIETFIGNGGLDSVETDTLVFNTQC